LSIILGILCFQKLEEFEAKGNQLTDITELEMCSSLKRLNLRDNFIDDPDCLFYISTIPLVELNLCGNPIRKRENYKELIQYNLPGLKKLDDGGVDYIDFSESTYTRPETSNASVADKQVDVLSSNDFSESNRSLLRGSCDTVSHLRPPSKGKRINISTVSSSISIEESTSPITSRKPRIVEQEFDIHKSISITKDLKPVVVKKTVVESNLLLHQVKNQQEEMEKMEEITSNIDKINDAKRKVLQKHYEENPELVKSHRGNNRVIIVFNFQVPEIDKTKTSRSGSINKDLN
jgi:hypothetical protein